MNLYINPVIAGIILTLIAEFVIMIIYTAAKKRRK